ncbi:filamin-B [Patella vulgata]|uniref:filamin-B n=1 Tax=Patella vulgata TaxID=6465 RepID=UPI0024A7C9E8|nr:filamin-B [Patella vulgata]
MMMENSLQMSMNGFRTMNTVADAQWIQIQRNTFTNWVNEQLKRRNIVIDDISEDLRNGVILIALVEELSGNVIKTRVPRPQNQHEKLQNVSVALDVLSRDGVRISNIDSTDVVRGNIKLILSLIWQLVLRYQVGLSAVQHRQWFLKWLKAVLPDVTITNFGRDWNDGIALYALLEFCRPGLCSNWPNINKHDRLNNCRNAMKLARQHFGIPMVLRPDDLASPDLDERSAMTYLSYFIKYGGPGYSATLDRLQNRIRTKIITNFTTDWHDGEALAELVSNSGKNLPDLQDEIGLPVELIRKSINVGKYLGVESVLTAEEITEETREHLGIMTYVSQFLPHSEYTQTINYHDVSFNRITTFENDSNFSNTTSSLTGNSLQHIQQPQSSNFHLVRHRESTAIDYPTKETTKIDIYSVGVIIDTKVHKPFDPERVRIEAVAPSGRVVKMTGDGHYSAQFLHTEIGEWKVSLYYKEKFIDGCPIDICDPSQVRVVGLKAGSVGKLQEFHIDCTKGGDGEVGVDVTHNGRQIISHVTQVERGMYRVTYTPYDPGPYSIDVTFNGAEVRDSDFYTTDPEERQRKAVFYTEFENVDDQRIKVKTSCDWEIDYITGGPFVCHVTDGSDIQVYGMNDGTICSTPQLIADCSKAGNGILQAEVMYNGQKYSARITEERLNVYRITFRPTGPGIYKIWLTYDGKPVKGSPFIQEIDELEQPIVSGEGLVRAMPQRTSTFIVDPRGCRGNPSVNILGPTQVVPCQIEPQSNGTFKVYYTAVEKGQYIIDVKFDHKEIEGSPYKLWVVDPSLVRVSGGWRPLMGDGGFIPLVVNKEKHIPFDASEAGNGELTAEVRGPSGHKIPVAVDARSDGRNTVIFTPRNEGRSTDLV